jgi:hypothetical protein
MTDWLGRPLPPSQLQTLIRDDPFNRAYGATFGRRIPRGLASSFEDYLRARLRTRVETSDEIFDFLRLCLYAKDSEVHGRAEVWIHPEDFERIHAGDCDDHALWAWVQFVRLGWDARFTAGFHDGGGHAWVTLFRGGETLLCESTAKRMPGFLVRAAEHPEYEPVWSVDGQARFWWHGPLPEEDRGIRFLDT